MTWVDLARRRTPVTKGEFRTFVSLINANEGFSDKDRKVAVRRSAVLLVERGFAGRSTLVTLPSGEVFRADADFDEVLEWLGGRGDA